MRLVVREFLRNLCSIGGTFEEIGWRTMDLKRGIAVINTEDLGTARSPRDLEKCLVFYGSKLSVFLYFI